jgi:hypothetical protein
MRKEHINCKTFLLFLQKTVNLSETRAETAYLAIKITAYYHTEQ